MKVAIIVPYFNEFELLKKTILSILDQSYTDWHLYLIDDGSEEGKRAHEHIDSHHFASKITIIFRPNRGVSAARNTALDLISMNSSIGAVAYCDSDDRWDPGYLKSQIEALEHCDLAYVVPRTQFVDGSLAVPFGISNPPIYPGLQELIKGNFIYISGVVHKLECLEVGYFDSDLDSIEDWDFWVRIAKYAFKLKKNIGTCFTYIVKPQGNMASKRTSDILDKFRQKHSK